ncbi:hypothetical protein GLYMA_11G226850v4 [Glycine max]|nr:hypothetical protein GLYMA_11G226850v4 [Glycine max]KAH1160383.1 hypothetical protein GYH30_031922 [Glycine max]
MYHFLPCTLLAIIPTKVCFIVITNKSECVPFNVWHL